MNQPSGVKTSLAGAAVLAACACGASTRLAGLNASYGGTATAYMFHPIFLAVGGALILIGLWRRQRRLPFFALLGLGLLMAGEFLIRPMSISPDTHFSTMQILGLLSSLAAAALLVYSFYRAYPSSRPAAALTAMSGAAAATGCDCCLVTMGVTGTLQALLPSQPWLSQTLSLYVVAAALMAFGLGRLGGLTPALVAVAGQAWVYYWLELPYSSLPTISMHGINVNFMIKYPMMLSGTLIVMGAFALAYRIQEARVTSTVTEQAVAGD